jgi:hypothetical protein
MRPHEQETSIMRLPKAAMAALAILGLAQTAKAGSGPEFMDCNVLWQERNAIYKDAGYCFKTARAIRVFGNANCRYDSIEEVPLSTSQRRDIADIQRYERSKRCPR